jgi:WD40 repeat protein
MSVASVNNRSIWATLPRTERGRPIVLGADPKGKNFLYTHANSVVIRDLANPETADIYTQHSCQVNVAKYSPSGFYIASADKSGKVRIWDTINQEHILKSEFQPISGPIYDLAWSADNQRIVVVGEGREKFGHVFLADTGTSNGDVSGQTRPINTCDFKPSRPFRIITGSEDNSVAFFEGPPFKFKGLRSVRTKYYLTQRKITATLFFTKKPLTETKRVVPQQRCALLDGVIYALMVTTASMR